MVCAWRYRHEGEARKSSSRNLKVFSYVFDNGGWNDHNLDCNSSPISNMAFDLRSRLWFAANSSNTLVASILYQGIRRISQQLGLIIHASEHLPPRLWFPPQPLKKLLDGDLHSISLLRSQPQRTLGRKFENYKKNSIAEGVSSTIGVTLHLFKMDGWWTSPYPRFPVCMKGPRYHADSFPRCSIILDIISSGKFVICGLGIFLRFVVGRVFDVQWVYWRFITIT